MKLKSLFLCMLGAAVLVGCNNEIDGGYDGPVDQDGKPIIEGESTTASFSFRFAQPNTYSGDTELTGYTGENVVKNLVMFVYKTDGSAEAMAFLSKIEDVDRVGGVPTGTPMITVKCKSGQKLIYVATNIGAGTGVDATFLEIGTNAGNTFESSGYLGEEWEGTGAHFDALNAPVWAAAGGTIRIDTLPTGPNNTSAASLIQALNNNATVSGGVLTGINATTTAGYLMSNWLGSADTVKNSAPNYHSTVAFLLEPNIAADDSRSAAADVTNSLKKNALLINIQRALAKVAVSGLAPMVAVVAGSGTSEGKFTPIEKWALGNINSSTTPFQLWNAGQVRSTRSLDTAPIIPKAANQRWANKLDNSRFVGSGQSYEDQNLTVTTTMTTMSNAPGNLALALNAPTNVNGPAGSERYALVTENNNNQTYNHYSTFIVFAGKYAPEQYITSVSNIGTPTFSTGAITYPNDNTQADTLYYLNSEKLFFYGKSALFNYIGWVVLNKPAANLNGTDADVLAKLADYMKTEDDKQADLQQYYQGNCFYRVWVRDPNATNSTQKILVRRNHAYNINIDKILGPGIGDPNDIIDPHPEDPEPIEEADTYVTATINVMDWHVINHTTDVELN